MAKNSPPSKPAKEEPEIGNERDIPSDGRDAEGEKMIREVKPTQEPSPPPKRQ
jgi:hypothetical protein